MLMLRIVIHLMKRFSGHFFYRFKYSNTKVIGSLNVCRTFAMDIFTVNRVFIHRQFTKYKIQFMMSCSLG